MEKDEKIESLKEQLKDLDDTEFEIMFIDSICKKLKSLDRQDIKSNTLLFMYMSVIDSIKRYKELAIEFGRQIQHADAVDLIISRGESYLTDVANDNTADVYSSKAMLVSKEMSELHDIVKDLLLVLKNDLVNTPKYEYLKPGCTYK